ncbi:MAG: peptide-methionine (S)-S-oxide reductase MsrA [Flavobacteriaceae bacterium]|nr:peptide-methionine (S)-S-oxide reductase MsrA [Flavobacteriaceae bacterium]
MKKKVLVCLLFTVSVLACQNTASQKKPLSDAFGSKFEVAYFASGCFWCVEAIFESVKGVHEVISGYSGGFDKSPTYYEVSNGNTGHAETVAVFYDPKEITYQTLLEVFFGSHDPTTLNRQGPDRGSQYRSAIFYRNENEKTAALSFIEKLRSEKIYKAAIVTELVPFVKFYEAEDYHQDYERNNPNNPYIQKVSIPRLRRFQSKFPALLKENH